MSDADKTRQAIEALAELYLTGPDVELAPPSEPGEQFTAPHADQPPLVEGVLVGHLPGFASAWISQYADHLAGERGHVALCHVDADELDIELIEANPQRQPSALGLAEPVTAADRKLRDLLDELATGTKGWLVHLGDPVMPLTRWLASRLDTWTILTGCDEAALVAAYQLLKKLMRDGDGASPPQRVQLMFMGCDEDEAQQAVARLQRAAERFLRVPVTTIGSRRQMQPVRKRAVASFEHFPEADPPHWQTLMDFITGLETVPALEPVVAVAGPELPSKPQAETDEASDAPEPQQSEPQSSAVSDQAHASNPMPQASPEVLTDFIDNLSPLPTRCPHHPRVQLGLADDDHLHVLAHAEGDAIRSTCADLLAVAGWAQQNVGLIVGDHQVSTAAPPTLHLFVDRPKLVSDLVGSQTVNLHLLLPITVANNVTWHHVELN